MNHTANDFTVPKKSDDPYDVQVRQDKKDPTMFHFSASMDRFSGFDYVGINQTFPVSPAVQTPCFLAFDFIFPGVTSYASCMSPPNPFFTYIPNTNHLVRGPGGVKGEVQNLGADRERA